MSINAKSENRSSDIVDLEQVLIHFISKNGHSASSSQAPSASKRLFGSSLSVDYQSVSIYLPHFQGIWEIDVFLPEQHVFYFIIQLQCLIYNNRWH